MTVDVADNVARINERIHDAERMAGRSSGSVRLIAVSKRQPLAMVKQAIAAGHRDFGENQVQSMISRIDECGGPDVRWHMIGNLQSKKAKHAILAHSIHGIGSTRAIHAVDKALLAVAESPSALGCGIYLQVNIDAEESKSGFLPDQLEPALLDAASRPSLDLRGLMCIPKRGQGRNGFAALRELRDQMQSKTGKLLPELSMGMTADFEDAIAEGATVVRVGTGIFGARAT